LKQIGIYNNLFENFRIGVRIKGQRISDVFIKNNIMLNHSVAEVEAVGDNIVCTHNLKYPVTQPEWRLQGVAVDANNLSGDPGLRLTGNRWAEYYQPLSNASMVIGNGTDVGLPFTGTAPNIGPW
jgi:hypothetical protein